MHGNYGLLPTITPVPHQFHQHCLWLKKHISSYKIFCTCLFVTATAGYIMAVLLSSLIYLVLVPLWSITTALICTYPPPRGGRALPRHARTRAAPPRLSRAGAYSLACT